MRRALSLLVLTLALAGPAGAQQATPGAATALRGSQSAGSPVAPAPAGDVAATAAAALAQSTIPLRSLPDTPVAGAAGQCRLSCAQSYYFCLSGDGGDDCPATWSQCRAACDAPGVAGLAGG
ncbi:hypothetical protein [Phenylobacterium sp.]|uniref:hypothetical protein n=1 Tax=Phenylobacterium sp. TaxID=1871053 RepID=UPI00271F69FB|nr:hypothetical protein [Phenylobacterium sp.]MDO8800537.1 hypothetical protein [Phenylobacterium sp.]